jgi:hypothetical protein
MTHTITVQKPPLIVDRVIDATEIGARNQAVTDKMAVLWDLAYAAEGEEGGPLTTAMTNLCNELTAALLRLGCTVVAPTSGGENKP